MDRHKTYDKHGVDRLTTTTTEEPQEAEKEIVEQDVTLTDANIVPKIEPLSDNKKKKEEEGRKEEGRKEEGRHIILWLHGSGYLCRQKKS